MLNNNHCYVKVSHCREVSNSDLLKGGNNVSTIIYIVTIIGIFANDNWHHSSRMAKENKSKT